MEQMTSWLLKKLFVYPIKLCIGSNRKILYTYSIWILNTNTEYCSSNVFVFTQKDD